MTLRHLNVFLCVSDEGNMTAAADKLHIAQPSVSQTIAELEKYYNVKLFERLGRKLFLTIAGQKLMTYARHIVNLSREVEDVMREHEHNGVIRLGASVTVGTCILSDIIGEFVKCNSNVKIISSVNNTKIIEGMLLLDKVDIGLVEGKIHSPGILCEPFMDDELVFVSGVSHPLAQKGSVKLSEIDNMEFIVREEGSGTRELFESVMNSKGIPWQIYGVYNNAETIKNTVAAGLAISVMSRMAVQKEVKNRELAIVDVDGLYFKRQFSIVYHKNKYISPLLHNFIQLCMGHKNIENGRSYS
ncbi:LysR family transcriptional regulator [Anaerosporomusa subterranea]|uniref:LysR family transcriptional regulator n=1 Tax=Anaerosporomusa subterranea TaxID=1794912 RepID=A0A154BUY6_ANASB|nr:LysR family transcriptional regulator [Anaerosporomusa subterranea]KYZ77786.1 LysR family transcriptional regulator [Anaerosporomusa subterranea]